MMEKKDTNVHSTEGSPEMPQDVKHSPSGHQGGSLPASEEYDPDFISFMVKLKLKTVCPLQMQMDADRIVFLKGKAQRQTDMHNALRDAEKKVLDCRDFLSSLTRDKVGTDTLRMEEDNVSTKFVVTMDEKTYDLHEYIREKYSAPAKTNVKGKDLRVQLEQESTEGLDETADSPDYWKQEDIERRKYDQPSEAAHSFLENARTSETEYYEFVYIPPEKLVYVEKFIPKLLRNNDAECKISDEGIELKSRSRKSVKIGYDLVQERMKEVEEECIPFYKPEKLSTDKGSKIWDEISNLYNCIIVPVATAQPVRQTKKQYVPVIHHFQLQRSALHLFILEGHIDNICLQRTIHVIPGKTDAIVRRSEEEKKIEISMTRDVAVSEMHHIMKDALSWASLNSSEIGLVVDDAPCPLHLIAEVFVSCCKAIKKSVNVYLVGPKREAVVRAFKFTCNEQDWKEVVNSAKKEELELECKDRQVPDYTRLGQRLNVSVHVDKENKINPHASSLLCVPVIFDEYLKPYIQAHCPRHRRKLESKVEAKVNENSDLLGLDFTFVTWEEDNYLLYYTPEWGLGAGQAIARAMYQCVKKAKKDSTVIIVPPGITLLDTFMYPPKFLAQQVFQSLDDMLQEQEIRDVDIHLRVQHSPYSEAFKAEMNKRKKTSSFLSWAKCKEMFQSIFFEKPEKTKDTELEMVIQLVGVKKDLPRAIQKLKELLKMPDPGRHGIGLGDTKTSSMTTGNTGGTSKIFPSVTGGGGRGGTSGRGASNLTVRGRATGHTPQATGGNVKRKHLKK
ncbi:uncharacterized protein LOC101852116 isoform X2 [Aplysia californica]|uniref:Uncharacterized protein LOC101852116 isoform X2 n=1 Tax=Aplysia californica TaxID=6500 RepID=A0ABM0K119_APLCA|nr:uncharacterized protein LOC101852116 isoform X2 [Aplysia californica]